MQRGIGEAFTGTPVSRVAALPGKSGAHLAFVAEAAISVGMMSIVLRSSDHRRLSRCTGVMAGRLVAACCNWHALVPALAAVFFFSAADAAEIQVHAIQRIVITVADATPSIGFYRDVLGFEVISEETVAGKDYAATAPEFADAKLRIVHMRLGAERVDLVDWLSPESAPMPADSKSNDLWFQHLAIVVRDMKAAHARLEAAKVRGISEAPQTLPMSNPNAGGIQAYYFRDPDGHPLELIHFPPDKGEPRWQMPGPSLFQGIDHTAIAVSDTGASLAFYEKTLGLRVAGSSDNSGIEQEKLSGVSGAHVRITGLRATTGPGIEFLEYLQPPGGRARPAGAKLSDLLTWMIVVGVPPDARPELLADPDGHLVRIAP